ncbi:DODA-type extradiol aromatic ring-opening family dioxygenase [Asticcacaulis tiandongensis]|uniref:DODA-type extradiol aromatic ring-opening family dioxygenase n=1 Tax=Asticcacaulis tiandongensis TaxID=2565365 RepID=UPI00112B4F6A|nr:class III extradiol ring-cleavage dioxygenase [Asticcacaulis tiandongensis]
MTDITQDKASRLPTLFIPHGGGPCFFMEWNPPHMWDQMGDYLRGIAAQIKQKPKAIIVVSAHWEEDQFTVQATPAPDLYFDYYGFPDHTYQLSYPSKGAPELAARVTELASQAGIVVNTDTTRGYDHGVFIPLLLIYPDADIPVIQLSLKKGYDPEAHSDLGKALAPLRDEGVLIIASGMSFHDVGALMRARLGPDPVNASHHFDNWLNEAVTGQTGEARNEALTQWASAPGARVAHPREDHLLPLMVAAGAAGEDAGERTYSETLQPVNTALSGFQFG